MRELHYGNYDAATTELLVELDRLYPLPNDATRAERAAATSAAVTRWMTRATADIERMIPELIASVRFRGSNER